MRYILWLISFISVEAMAQPFSAERIFLSLEKESCMPGDTLFVSGQLTASDNEKFYADSRFVYIECIDDREQLLLRQKVACDEKGYFQTGVPTQFDWTSHLCYLRAYTQLMQNYAPESFTIAPFLLGTTHPRQTEVAREVHIRCFPEGGTLLEGFQQNIVFQLSDDDGFPIVPAQVRLLNAENDTIIHSVAVSKNGLGRLAFQPEAGKSYRLQAEYDNRFFHFPLEVKRSDTALQAILNRNRLSCRIFTAGEGAASHLYLYHAETGLQEIPFQSGQQAVVLDLSEQPKGIYTLFLTNEARQVLNERLLWLPVTQSAAADCQLTQTTFAPETPVNYQLQGPDSSRVFARIVPANDLMATQAYPSLLFGNEIGSPVRFPLIDSRQWDKQAMEINNWLFTAHFTLFSADRVLQEGMHYPYPTEDVMLLLGTARISENRLLEEGSVLSLQNADDQLFYSGIVGEKGQFVFPVENYAEGTRFLISAQNRKGKSIDCNFTLTEKSYPKICIPYPIFPETQLQTEIQGGENSFRYSVDENQDKVYHIDDITVQGRKKVNIREAGRSPINFIGRVELQKRASLSIRSIIERFPGITFQMVSEGGGSGELSSSIKKARFNTSSRGRETYSGEMTPTSGELGIFWKNNRDRRIGNTTTGNNKLTVVVDDEVAYGDINYILEQPAGLLESIEILKASDTRCARYEAKGGVVLIKTLHGLEEPTPEKSQTALYPQGLSVSQREPSLRPNAPKLPGHYLLLVDVITKEKQIVSFCKPFEVK